jgi:hypothetical protein
MRYFFSLGILYFFPPGSFGGVFDPAMVETSDSLLVKFRPRGPGNDIRCTTCINICLHHIDDGREGYR